MLANPQLLQQSDLAEEALRGEAAPTPVTLAFRLALMSGMLTLLPTMCTLHSAVE